MTSRFISYAQNLEDVMLWRALKNESPGSYVDVGANDPMIDSVSKAFYDRGWRGINIDAVPVFVDRLQKERPEDANHHFFAGARSGTTEFYRVGETGLSTFRQDYAESYRGAGHAISKLMVETRTLNSILQDSGIDNRRFHFLKVDVEGAESDVLLGLDLDRFRPWIIVMEATEPNSTILSLDYEPLILSHRYRCCYFDGLSRFYVAEERAGLMEAFRSPPCVFDEFDRLETVQAREAALTAASRADELDERLSETLGELMGVTEALDEARKLMGSRELLMHSLHAGMISFERRASRLHSNYRHDCERAGAGLANAFKKLYRSSLWRRGSWLTRLFSSKSPRGSLDKAAAAIMKLNARHERTLREFHEDIIKAIDAPATQEKHFRLGKSAAAIAHLIHTGFSGKSPN